MSPSLYNLDDYKQRIGKPIREFHEAPMLTERVRKGELPSVVERLPNQPLVMETWEEIGAYGGSRASRTGAFE